MTRTCIVLTICLMSGWAAADTLEIPIAIPAVQDGATGGSWSVWNRLDTVRIPGQLERLAYPVLVLLPPDLKGNPQVALMRDGCEVADGPGNTSGRRLYSFADGKTLPVSTRLKDQVDAAAFPVTTEGDAMMLPVLLFPERPDPTTGEWTLCRRLTLTITYSRSDAVPPEMGHYSPRRFTRHLINPEMFDLWYEPYDRAGPTYDFVIVARESFVESSSQLDDFVAHKKDRGFSPLVVTLEQIEADMANQGLKRPEMLREWLQKSYKGLGFQYLLIIGNPDHDDDTGIPMKRCWPAMDYESPDFGLYDVPTDLYYADLTGNWNPDGDEYWCELEDYMELPEDSPADPDSDRFDGVDLTPELLVGRIPHFGKLPFYGDGILLRLMEYDQMEPGSWHNRVLLPSPQVTFPDGGWVDASLVSEFLIEESLSQNAIAHTVLSECEGNLLSKYKGDGCLNENTFPEHWNQGYSAVFWCAHGSQEAAVRDIWNIDANQDGLPQQGETEEPPFVNNLFHKVAVDDYPAVVFQGSCLNADPQTHGNLTHALLQHVSVANVSSSRLTMGLDAGDKFWEPSPYSPGAFTLGVYFIHAAVSRRKPFAEAFHYAQNTLVFGAQPWTLKVRMEFNLYGDPSMRIPGCDGDDDCDDADICNGAETCVNGLCVPGEIVVCTSDEPTGPCRNFICQPDGGCAMVNMADNLPCSDGNPCTELDYCLAGECLADPVVCPLSQKACWESICDPDQDGCMLRPLGDGATCQTGAGLGFCADGTCIVTETVVESPAPELTPDVISSDTDGTTVEADVSPSGGGGCSASHRGCPASFLLFLLLTALLLVRRKLPV